jgi:polyisoprenoid-binding protein YceI
MITNAAPRIAAGTYRIDPDRSTVQFRVTHSFGLGPVDGTFTVHDGEITVADDPTESTVRVRLDAASFRTDKPRRDTDVTAKRFLNADAFPLMEFVSTAVVRTDERWELHGRLTVRGITAPVVLHLDSGAPTADGCRFRATVRIDRYAYRVGIRGIVARYLDADIDVVATTSVTG